MKIVLIGLVVLVVLGGLGLFYLGHASRDGAAPGLVQGRLAPCPAAPNCVSSEAGTPEEKRVDALPVDVWETLPDVVVGLGGTITRRDGAYIAVEFVSRRFKFVDDVEFRLAEDAVHVRSGSRVGYSDAGANRSRVTTIKDALGQQ